MPGHLARSAHSEIPSYSATLDYLEMSENHEMPKSWEIEREDRHRGKLAAG